MALALQAVLLLAACGGSPPALPLLPTDATVLAFGDSITHGTGATPENSYPAVLARLIDREVVNAGIPGETTAEGRERLPGVLAEVRPDLVLLCLGGNDFLRSKPDDAVRANLAAMIERLRDRGIPVVLIEVPQPKLLLSGHPLYGDLGERYGVPVLDDTLTDILGESHLRSDRIHPNAAGYNRLAEALAGLLRETGAI
ncbi:arylesterase [Salinisphaera sp. PC39]|uniref:arylesterase n=1 Tax=Salinisphaera sp. PC39 TaxID=1304156 RepID=UPI0033404EC2